MSSDTSSLHAFQLETPRAALFEYELPLKRPLATGSGTIHSRPGAVGWGEAAPLPGRGSENLASALSALNEWLSLESFDDSLPMVLTRARTHLEHSPCAWAAAGGALADLVSGLMGIPLYEFLRRYSGQSSGWLSGMPPGLQSNMPSDMPPGRLSDLSSGLPASSDLSKSSIGDSGRFSDLSSGLPSDMPPGRLSDMPSDMLGKASGGIWAGTGAGIATGTGTSTSNCTSEPSPRDPSPRLIPTAALIDGANPDAVARQARRARSAGYTTFKLKLGFKSFECDLKRVAALRSAVGSEAALRLDANGAWSPDEALPKLEALAEYRPEFVEEPCSGLEEIRRLQVNSPFPLAVDESLPPLGDLLTLSGGAATRIATHTATSLSGSLSGSSPPNLDPNLPANLDVPEAGGLDGLRSTADWGRPTDIERTPDSASPTDLERPTDFRKSADLRSPTSLGCSTDLGRSTDFGVDAVVLKPSLLGSVTELSAAAAALQASGVKVVVSSALESAVGLTTALHLAAHLSAALGGGPAVGLGTADVLAVDLCEPPRLVGGSLVVPSGPGLGTSPSPTPAPTPSPTPSPNLSPTSPPTPPQEIPPISQPNHKPGGILHAEGSVRIDEPAEPQPNHNLWGILHPLPPIPAKKTSTQNPPETLEVP